MAFLQTAKKGSCAVTWNGTKSQPAPGPHYQGQIARLRQLGGDVMPTFGGFSADSTTTEIADSCTSVSTIAADYEAVIKGYHVTRLDMDVEVNSLDNKAGVDRRNKAIALTEANVAYNKLSIINIQGAGTSFLQAMQRGDIDLFIGWEPFESQAEEQGLGVRIEALDYSKSKAVGDELGLVGVNRDYLAKNREAVKRLVWAYLTIQDRLNKSKQEFSKTIAAYTGLPESVADNVAKVTTLGQFLTLEQMQRQAATFNKLGVLTKDVSGELDAYFDRSIAAEMAKA